MAGDSIGWTSTMKKAFFFMQAGFVKFFILATLLMFFTGMSLVLALLFVERMFGFVTIESIVLQLRMPLTGVDQRYFVNFGLLILCVVLLTGLLGINLLRSLSSRQVLGLKAATFRIGAGVFSAMLLAGSLYAAETKYQTVDFFFPDNNYYTYVFDNYVPPVVEAEDGVKPNNLLLIVLESVETAVNDERLFSPPLMPRLGGLEGEGVALKGQRDVIGAAYSISSFYSVMLGMPLLEQWTVRKGMQRHLGRIEEIDESPFATKEKVEVTKSFVTMSLPGLLERNGFDVSFFCPADARFTDYDAFLRGSTERVAIYDFPYFKANNPDWEDWKGPWGVSDHFLFTQVREYLRTRTREKPFLAIVQTANSHLPGSYEKGMARPYGDYRDVFPQADAIVADFVEWVRRQPFGDETTIVIYGDHLCGQGKFGPVALPARDKRSIMAMILNSRQGHAGQVIEKTFATWDLTPTILEAMGFELPQRRFGLGTSLFAPQRTLLQRDGVARYEKMARKRSKFYEECYLW